ncbi:MAG: hypothetical protein Athens071416_192 [Parcubacteria group bacterium Athens0714_16]|nr:MAG: hypothetical protein Athens071416_192 [Parcubacteria group bacterium Athens0714_16]
MKKEKLVRSVTILGLLCGLIIHFCFYSNLIFENIKPPFTLFQEIIFGLLFISGIGVFFGEITESLVRRLNEHGAICNISLGLLISSSCLFVVFVFAGINFNEYFQFKNYLLEKIAILWVFFNLWPLFIYIWSRKTIFEKKCP